MKYDYSDEVVFGEYNRAIAVNADLLEEVQEKLSAPFVTDDHLQELSRAAKHCRRELKRVRQQRYNLAKSICALDSR